MKHPAIAVVNLSKRISTDQLHRMVAACRVQLVNHVGPAWGRRPPTLQQLTPAAAALAPADVALVTISDAADDPGALGYHEELGDRVVGKVFADPVLDNGGTALGDPRQLQGGYSVSATLSHELVELFLDPDANLYADGPDGHAYAFEGCDACEDASYLVDLVDGKQVAVSDFCLPAWFDPEAPTGAQLTYLGSVTMPFTLAPGGYAIVRAHPGAETQVFGDRMPEWRRKVKAAGLRMMKRSRVRPP